LSSIARKGNIKISNSQADLILGFLGCDAV